jgi:hypothetical protein
MNKLNSVSKNSGAKHELDLLLTAIAGLSLAIFAALAFAWFQTSKIQQLALAAGSSSGESYILGNALEESCGAPLP